MVRVKQRYVVAEVILEKTKTGEFKKVKESELYRELKNAILKCHGECGWMVIQETFKVKYLNSYTHICLFRAKRDFYHILLDSIPLVNKINNISITFRILHIAGSIRSCEKFIAKYHFWSLPKLLSQCESIEHQEELKKSIEHTAGRLT